MMNKRLKEKLKAAFGNNNTASREGKHAAADYSAHQQTITQEEALAALHGGYDKAERMMQDTDKTERFLQRLEKKLTLIPVVGRKLSEVPVFISLVRSYINKEYTEIPLGTVIAILSALIYLFSPIDIVIDGVPLLGYLDDVAVTAICWNLVSSDVKEYMIWRASKGRLHRDIQLAHYKEPAAEPAEPVVAEPVIETVADSDAEGDNHVI